MMKTFLADFFDVKEGSIVLVKGAKGKEKTVIAGGFIESRPEQRFYERTEGNLIRTADPLPFRTSGEGVFAVGKEILFCNISQIADI